jgi:hypothetical protein
LHHLLLEHQRIAQVAALAQLLAQLYLAVLAVVEIQLMITTVETELQIQAVELVAQELLALLMAVQVAQAS